MICQYCNGTGKIKVPDPITKYEYPTTCAACQGTGESYMKPSRRSHKRVARDAWRQRELFEGR